MIDAVPLGEVVRLRKGKKAAVVHDSNINGARPYIQIDEVRGAPPAKFALDPQGVEIDPNDLCIVWDGANAGTVGYGIDGIIGSTVTRMRVLKPEEWDTRFIGRLLQSKFRELNEQAQGRGATIPHVNKAKLDEIPLPRISPKKQQRIADILDKADGIRRKRTRMLVLANELLRGLFLEQFGDPRKLEGTGLCLNDIATIARGRFSPRPRNDPTYYRGEFPFIQTGEIAAADGYLISYRQTLNHKGIRVSKSFPAGTVFVAIVGATIGETAISSMEFWCPDSVIGIVPNQAEYPPEFIEYLLRFWRPVFLDQAPETARPNINLQTLKPIPIPILTKGEGLKFAGCYKSIYALKRGLSASNDTLLKSLAARAFRGDL